MRASANAGRWLAATVILGVALSVAMVSVGELSGATPMPQGIPHDWSHRHVIFSRPRTAAMARRLERLPRYRMQVAWRRRQALRGNAEAYMHSLDARALQLAERGDAQVPPGWRHRKFPKPTPTPTGSLHGDWSVNLGGTANVGPHTYPAKFSFTGAPDCTNDFVVFNTGLQGESYRASIIAFNNLYGGAVASGGCGTSGVPAVDWAYNTGGTIDTSAVLSADGSQVAFVQAASSGAASLVILKWKAGQGTSATTPVSPDVNTTDASTFVNCKNASPAKSCELTLGFYYMHTDSMSSPFYDYGNDIIYVGDDGGYVHKFTGVFNGSPAESTSAPWPVAAHSNFALTSPVLDSGASPPIIFVGAAGGSYAYPGNLVAINTSDGTTRPSGLIGYDDYTDIADAPLVDSSTGKVYVAVGRDHVGQSAVFQFDRNFTGNTTGTEVQIGSGTLTSNGIPIYAGDFDNSYYDSSNGTGNLYVCGNAGGNPTLYQIPISAGAMGTPKAGPVVATSNVACSPITEIYNPDASGGPFDWIFLSVPNYGSACSSTGCIMSFIVTAWQPNNAYSLGQEILDSNLDIEQVTTAGVSGSSPPAWTAGTTSDATVVWTNQGSMGSSANSASRTESGGTSGIIIDNTSTSAGASQVYFGTLGYGICGIGGGGRCAVQASQAGLSE